VFTGRNDGRFIALDSDNGRLLWEFQTGAGVNTSGSVFEHDGEQYVAILSAGNSLIGSAHGDSVWLFGLNGTLNETTPGDTPLRPPPVPTLSSALQAPNPARGAELYRQTCLPCHGDDGLGGHGGGAPLSGLGPLDQVARVVRDGRDNMPPFGAALSEQQILDVSAWLLTAFDGGN
jgi:alcohol dehydrogenase (cytochrome c)